MRCSEHFYSLDTPRPAAALSWLMEISDQGPIEASHSSRLITRCPMHRHAASCVTHAYSSNAHLRIHNVPEVRVTRQVIDAIESTLTERIESHQILLGDFDSAIWHLNQLDAWRGLTCRQILERYGNAVHTACADFESDQPILAIWVLALIPSGIGRHHSPTIRAAQIQSVRDGNVGRPSIDSLSIHEHRPWPSDGLPLRTRGRPIC